jgi:hypothetical protein
MRLSLTIAAGPRQRIHPQVRVPQNSWPHFTVSDSRAPNLRESESHFDWRSVSLFVLVSSPVRGSWPDVSCCLTVSVLAPPPPPGAQVSVFIFPRNRVAQLYHPALGSVSVAFYDSQGYDGGNSNPLPHPGGPVCYTLTHKIKAGRIQNIYIA